MKRLSEEEAERKPYLPYPDYESDEYKKRFKGNYSPCVGPNGKLIDKDTSSLVSPYQGIPDGFPYPDVGSWEALGLDEGVCFDRYSRLGPYGLEDPKDKKSIPVNFQEVQWGKLQNDCLRKNGDRFKDPTEPDRKPGIKNPDYKPQRKKNSDKRAEEPANKEESRAHEHRSSKQFKSRSAVLIRTWDTYEYQENDIMAVRSLVSELALQSGGEYQVFLFVNIKENKIPIFKDEEIYQETIERFVPEELRDMAILWTEQVCEEWYPKVGEWDVYWEQFMPLQWFSKTHPEFDYVWNWEMDARLIGQHYHFTESVATFAKKQPRKYLWERNSRYYIPAIHGDFDNFFHDTNHLIDGAKPDIHTIWGPEPWSPEQTLLGPQPPTDEDRDPFQWGVGEEADFITLLPMWDPRETWWSYRDKCFNYPPSELSDDERQYPHVPRRVFINTLVRFSKNLLNAMHYENLAGLSMASEMWPASVALQHGFKAVYAPHPIWQSHLWDPDYMDLVFNADGWGAGSLRGGNVDDGRGVAYVADREARGEPQLGTGPNGEGRLGRWSQERDSPYNPDREHNFAGWSWYFWSDLPRVLYWRWMGWKAGFQIVTIGGTKVTDELGVVGGGWVSLIPCFDHRFSN